MSNEAKKTLNLIILALVSPPYLLILLNLVHSFFGPNVFFQDEGPSLDFDNNHYLGPLLWLFFIPYCFVYRFRFDENIFLLTKIFVSGAAGIVVMDPWVQTFNECYFVCFLFLTAFGMFGLKWKTFKANRSKVNFGKYPLAIDRKGHIKFPTDSLHMNVQIVGGTGTGKTRYVIKPFIEQTILQGLGCFIYDVKGNMARDVAFYFSQSPSNQKQSLYHFEIANPKKSHTYNPLYGNNPDAIANRVFTALYYDTRNMEPYYVELGKAFLHNLVGLLKKEIKTLTFMDLLMATEETDTFRTVQWFCAKYPESPNSRYFKHQWLAKPAKQRQEELSGLVTKLQRFCNTEWAHLLNVKNPDIIMKEVVNRDDVFLFSPDAARYPDDAKPLAILAMMDLSEQVAARYESKPEKPFRVFLDEFYNLAYPRFIDFINKCREAQVNLFLAHQSLGDLRGVSYEFQEQVMNTARNKIVLGVDDPETAEHFARQFGTEEDKDYKVESFKSDGSLAGFSKPQLEKFRFHPNLIKRLQAGQAVVKIVGQGGVHVFQTDLKPAAQVPEEFESHRFLYPRKSRNLENEGSLVEVVEPRKSVQPVRLALVNPVGE